MLYRLPTPLMLANLHLYRIKQYRGSAVIMLSYSSASWNALVVVLRDRVRFDWRRCSFVVREFDTRACSVFHEDFLVCTYLQKHSLLLPTLRIGDLESNMLAVLLYASSGFEK